MRVLRLRIGLLFWGTMPPTFNLPFSHLHPLNPRQHKRLRPPAWASLPADRYAVGCDQAAPIGLRIWVHKGGDAGLAAFLRSGARFGDEFGGASRHFPDTPLLNRNNAFSSANPNAR